MARTKKSKPGGVLRELKQAEKRDGNDELAKNLRIAFDQKRALVVRTRTRPGTSLEETKSTLEGNALRSQLCDIIKTSRLTAPAYIAVSTATGHNDWFILCIFTDASDTRVAHDGLAENLNLSDFPDIQIDISLLPRKKVLNIAKRIKIEHVLPPRESLRPTTTTADQTPEMVPVIETDVDHSVTTTQPPPLSRITKVDGQYDDDDDENDDVDGEDDDVLMDGIHNEPVLLPHVPSSAAEQTPMTASDIQTPTLSVPDLTSTELAIPPNGDESEPEVINVQELQKMSPSEQIKYQARYLLLDQTGKPNFGCILCLRKDHLWDKCPLAVCMFCQQTTHTYTTCPTLKRCSKCKERGHMVDTCTSKLKWTRDQKSECLLCGESTHFEDSCPDPFRSSGLKAFSDRSPMRFKQCPNCAATDHQPDECQEPRSKPAWVEEPRQYTRISEQRRSRDTWQQQSFAAESRSDHQQRSLQQPSSEQQPFPTFPDCNLGYANHPANMATQQAYADGYWQTMYPYYAQGFFGWVGTPSVPAGNAWPAQSAGIQEPSYQIGPNAQSSPASFHTPDQHQQAYSVAHTSTSLGQTFARGNDGYVHYQGYSQPPGSTTYGVNNTAPQPFRVEESDEQRWASQFSQQAAPPPPSSIQPPPPPPPPHDVPPPPPPPSDDYGRRQTFHAVPPPPRDPPKPRGGGRKSRGRGGRGFY